MDAFNAWAMANEAEFREWKARNDIKAWMMKEYPCTEEQAEMILLRQELKECKRKLSGGSKQPHAPEE